MNIENLLKVKAMILEEPRRFSMTNWITTGNKKELESRGLIPSPCGTVACIAGWGAIIARLEQSTKPGKVKTVAGFVGICAPTEARRFFEIDSDFSDGLFYDSTWPRDLRLALDVERPGTAGYARVAAVAIDRFIACGGDWDRDKGPAEIGE